MEYSTSKQGIEITLNTEDDCGKLNKMLQKEQPQFHTFQLRFEKPLKAVLRNVHLEQDLKERKYPTI